MFPVLLVARRDSDLRLVEFRRLHAVLPELLERYIRFPLVPLYLSSLAPTDALSVNSAGETQAREGETLVVILVLGLKIAIPTRVTNPEDADA